MKAQSAKVAIVGMSGRFPKAVDVAAFWDALAAGRELIEQFSEADLLEYGLDSRALQDARYVRARPILDDVSQFDTNFFGMSAREAEVTDPQLRLLLECAWEALEESGYAPPTYDGTVGIYAGLRLSRYLDEHLLANPAIVSAMGRDYLMMINRKDSAATWVAYRLNLTGPAISVNTACSTSLVALHLAATALVNFECDVALAGGAALPCFGKEGYISPPDSPWSPDGHCRAFDQKASGTLEGAGCAMVALKRLEDALADGDIIHAVLLGSAVNNDGSHKVGYTAPGLDGQARVIMEAMAVANVTADDIGYVEAHGTATPLGDPIEIAALTAAYRQTTTRVADCPIGSVKSNVGHSGVAAGIVGLIKVVLSLKHGQIPPSLHYEVPNPAIDFQHSPFYVNTSLRAWPGASPRRAAVSSFGIGGTNAHVVLEEAPPLTEIYSPRRFFLLPVSARSRAATAAGLRRLAAHLEQNPGLPLSCVSVTLRTARAAFACRRAVVANDVTTAIARLRRAAETLSESPACDSPPRLAFRFANHGALPLGMMQHLYTCEPAFRDAFDHCNNLLIEMQNLDLRGYLCQPERDHQSLITSERSEITELATFTIQWALAKLLDCLGVRATALYGDGLGELIAAAHAGVFDLPGALALIMSRGHFSQTGLTTELQATLDGVRLAEPTIPFISSMTGTWIEPTQAVDRAYWVQQSVASRFHNGLREIADGTCIVVDIGSLAGLAKDSCAIPGMTVIDGRYDTNAYVAEDEAVLNVLAQVWERGGEIDWKAFGRGEKTRRLNLPAYPFVKSRYWIERPHGHHSSAPRLSETSHMDFSEVDHLTARMQSRAVASKADAEQDATAWRAILVENDALDEALENAERTADQADKPLVLILPSPPQTIPSGCLMLTLPHEGTLNIEQLRKLVEAAFEFGYRRVLLIDPARQVPTSFLPKANKLARTIGDDLTSRISRIWESTLGLANIQPADNFFDLGGDSFIAIQMVSEINAEFGMNIRPVELISSPTVSSLAELIEQELFAGLDETILESMLAEVDSPLADRMRKGGSEEP